MNMCPEGRGKIQCCPSALSIRSAGKLAWLCKRNLGRNPKMHYNDIALEVNIFKKAGLFVGESGGSTRVRTCASRPGAGADIFDD